VKPGKGFYFNIIKRRCEMEMCESGKLTPEKAIEILNKNGKVVTLEEAKAMLEFLQLLAVIIVNQYLRR
jgi:hypothetical protein